MTSTVTLRAISPQWQARHGLTPAAYQSTFDELVSKGYKLRSVSGYTRNGAERYAALFIKAPGGGAWAARHGMSADEYQSEFNQSASQGYRLTWVSGYEVSGRVQYAAVWEHKPGGAWAARHGMTATGYQQEFNRQVEAGYRLVHINTYTVGGSSRYAAIWEQNSGPAWVAKHGLTASAYQQEFNTLAAKGYRVRQVSGHHVGGKDYYAAIWDAATAPLHSARHGVPESWYQNVFENYLYQSYQPQYISVFASGSGARVNCIWTNTQFTQADFDSIAQKTTKYMSDNDVPGLAIAITKDERLIYAAGFGKADASTGEETGAGSVFRVASVSKPITAVAVMRLTRTHGVSLDDRVFGARSILGARYSTPKGNEQINDITVRHLLQHTSGFSNTPDDPMFQNLSYSHDELIKWVLGASDRFVDRTPGSVYEYCNFGYCLLGRIIEQRSGMSYEAYVKKYVLDPSGATGMQIAENAQSERKRREVVYSPSSAYDLNVRRFDAHGGWLASPIDLLRLMVRVDGRSRRTDLLSAADRTTMLTAAGVRDGNNNDPNYGLGWVINPQAHTGAMRGTGAIIAALDGGYAVAAVANRRPSVDDFSWGMSTLGSNIINSITNWPTGDLF